MANHIKNDKGESVIAVGAPGSVARMLCEFPVLIQTVREKIKRCEHEYWADDAETSAKISAFNKQEFDAFFDAVDYED
jgi:hypothetical protein